MPQLPAPLGEVSFHIDDRSMRTPILFATLPPALLEQLLRDTDPYAEERGAAPDHNLARLIEEQAVPPLAGRGVEVLESVAALLDICIQLSVRLAHQRFGPEVTDADVQVKNAWMVSQHEKDINTIHNHPPHHLSAIVFLRRPAAIDRPPCGYTCFVDRFGGMDVPPRPGGVCLFPSTLKHLVYPFYGEGERRTISINLSVDHPEAAALWPAVPFPGAAQ